MQSTLPMHLTESHPLAPRLVSGDQVGIDRRRGREAGFLSIAKGTEKGSRRSFRHASRNAQRCPLTLPANGEAAPAR